MEGQFEEGTLHSVIYSAENFPRAYSGIVFIWIFAGCMQCTACSSAVPVINPSKMHDSVSETGDGG